MTLIRYMTNLSEQLKTYLVEQLTDYLIQLHSPNLGKDGYVGGLIPSEKADENYERASARMEKHHWQLPDSSRVLVGLRAAESWLNRSIRSLLWALE